MNKVYEFAQKYPSSITIMIPQIINHTPILPIDLHAPPPLLVETRRARPVILNLRVTAAILDGSDGTPLPHVAMMRSVARNRAPGQARDALARVAGAVSGPRWTCVIVACVSGCRTDRLMAVLDETHFGFLAGCANGWMNEIWCVL